MNRRRRIYEGKAKILYEGPEPGTLIQFFKDDATAFNKKKHEVIDGKGVLNNRICEYVFTHLNKIGIPTHFIRRLNMREQLIKEVEMIPLEIVVRNVAMALSPSASASRKAWCCRARSSSSITSRMSWKTRWSPKSTSRRSAGPIPPSLMTSWRSPSASTTSCPACSSASASSSSISRSNAAYFFEGDMMRIILADEISPDSCRLWDIETQKKMDKDLFRRDMGGLVEAYSEVARRLGIINENEPIRGTGPVLVK